ncbi:fasciclin domain-containing protein [Kitasatospora viridis]|uniref:Putative surface protein with fasciclin (FAS1) repeats n=1 Tax=Kitasatospora viridis TaxID=281105 RepID=A0A561UQG6_9ACTN|nr:fasciclin domain-containing protein [Kitasatospora viridis]TWG01613.1 putative surface protein with fasciclin (FAS1) repeats [Kitasatospora viridis]
MRSTIHPSLLAVLVLALAPLAGCAGADGAAPAIAGPPPPETAFGQDCASLPGDGPGSLASMGALPVLDAIDQAKDLTQLSALVKTAKAKDIFDSMDNVTVFAPNDAAFAKLTDDQKKALTTQQGAGDLVRKLIVVRDLRRADLQGKQYNSLQGAVLDATGKDDDLRVGGARLLCGSIKTTNARLELLDQVPAFG